MNRQFYCKTSRSRKDSPGRVAGGRKENQFGGVRKVAAKVHGGSFPQGPPEDCTESLTLRTGVRSIYPSSLI